MTALAARVGVAARDVPATLTAIGFAAAAAIAAAGWYGYADVPRARTLAYLVIAAGIARFAMVRRPLPDLQATVVLLAMIVAAALLAATMVEASANALVGVAAAVGAGALLKNRPTVGFTAAFLLVGFGGSILAFTDLTPYRGLDAAVAGLCVATVLGYLSHDRTRAAAPVLGAVLFGLFIAITWVYGELAEVPAIGRQAFKVFAFSMLLVPAVAYGPWGPGAHRRMAKGVVIGTVLVAGYAVLRWIIGPAAAEVRLIEADGIGQAYNFAEGKLRVFGSFINTRSLGSWAAASIPMCAALAVHWRGWWRIAAAAAVALAFAALLGSGMRGGVPAIAVGGLYVAVVLTYTRAHRGFRPGIAAVVIAAVIAALTVVVAVSPDATTSERNYASILNPDSDRAYQERLYKWSIAWRQAEERPLGQGLGTAGIGSTYQRYPTIGLYDVDNSYLKIAVDQGVIGLGLFVTALLALLLGLGRRALATEDPQKAALAAGAGGTLAAFMVIMWTGTYVEGDAADLVWLITGLGLAQFATTRLADSR